MQGNQGVDIFTLNHPESGFFSGGDMVLRSADTVGDDAHYWTGGSFRIEQLDGSLGDLYSPYDPVIRANGDVLLDSYTGASLHILAGGKVEIPGTVFITGPDVPTNSITETITLSDGTAISIDGSAAPTLDVRAGINWDTPPGNTITGNVSPRPTLSDGTSADIIIGDIFTYSVFGDTGRVFLTNQYQPNTSLIGGITVGSIFPGDVSGGGSVTIDSRGGITLDGTVDVSTVPVFFSGDALQLLRTYLGDWVVLGTSFGDGGEATLLAKGDITLTPDASIRSQGLLEGNITLKSDATISVLGGNITSYSLTDVPGSKGGETICIALKNS